MTSANDNIGKSRRVREGFVRKWPQSSFEALTTDEALKRLADARNIASKSANKFMLLAALLSALYFLRLNGVAADLKMGDYSLAKIPFGLFIFTTVSLGLSCVALIRVGDSRAYDRQLLLACEQRYEACDCEVSYLAFPNEHAWGEPFSQMMNVISGGAIAKTIRFISLTVVNLFLLFLVLAPLAVASDFLWNTRTMLDAQFQDLQNCLVLFFSVANLGCLLLVSWARIADRD